MSGANGKGEASGPPARVEGNAEGEQLTQKQLIEAIDEDIADLQRQRETAREELQRYRSPEQVEARRATRVRYLGEAVLESPLAAALVERARDLAGKKHWVFAPAELAEDGVECEPVEEGGADGVGRRG